jgi:HK97 family phage prohead protease
MAVDLTPTEGMATAAKRGLRLHEEGKSGDGLKPETVARAGRLSRREEMNEEWVREMNAWFARHEADKKPGWDDPGAETPGFVAHLLWGGDAGKSFAARKVQELDREDDRSNAMEGMIEKRDVSFDADDEIVVETRSNGREVIRGLAIPYNRLSVDLGGFRERILPGAFDKILSRQRGKGEIVSYFNHDPNWLLGRESAGTLEITVDDRGISYVVEPPDTQAGRDVLALVRSKNLRGSSFSFTVSQRGGERFTTDENGRAIREVVEASGLFEMGPVVQPAYPSTSAAVAMRSYQAWLAEQATPESMPHEVGPDIVKASMRLRAARLRSVMRGSQAR